MCIENLRIETIGDTVVRYRFRRESGQVELNLFPACSFQEEQHPEKVAELSPLASVKLAQDNSCSGFGSGGTMRYSETMAGFAFAEQSKERNAIVTKFRNQAGVELIHRLSWKTKMPVFFAEVTLKNASSESISVELLESFALGGIGETLDNDDFSRLICHRFRSRWCDEALHEEWPLWQRQLERYPVNYAIRNERFGQTGTLPVRKFHPFAAVEDRRNGLLWGAYLCWNASWQLEFSMRNAPGLTLSGGLADREFGSWVRHLAPGESITAPRAMLSCVRGNFDELAARMVKGIESTLDLPESEKDLPVIFNEWCTTWGMPSHENMKKIAEKLKTLSVKYLVMDSGWYRKDGERSWAAGTGDWIANRTLFPEGISATAAMIRSYGLIPGIWFEAEVAGRCSETFKKDCRHFVHRDGKVITVGPRRFWNHMDPVAEKILHERVIRFIQDNHFGYVKIDYNDNIGQGCDNPDSPGEGIRQQGLGTYRFFRAMRKAVPDLVIENCASGGHRLEPGMFAASAMSSFSDAHELDTIPVIAASLHRLMPPRQMQVWAVLRSSAPLNRIVYLLSSAMLGRICLSGDILSLSEAQIRTLREALNFYRKIVPVIKNGRSFLQHLSDPRRSILRGGQVLFRISGAGNDAVVYFHAFREKPLFLESGLPGKGWSVEKVFPQTERNAVSLLEGTLRWSPNEEMSGCVVRVKRRKKESLSTQKN